MAIRRMDAECDDLGGRTGHPNIVGMPGYDGRLHSIMNLSLRWLMSTARDSIVIIPFFAELS